MARFPNPSGDRLPIPGHLQKTGVRMPWESPPGWGLQIYDPKTHKFESIDLCFGQSHAVFANDKDETLYFSLRTGGLGWFKTHVWNKTHDAAKVQGWCAPVIDYNGDGKTGAIYHAERATRSEARSPAHVGSATAWR